MNTELSKLHSGRGARGSTVLIVLVLLACLVVMLAANSTTLHIFKQELQRIDSKQKLKFEPAAERGK